MPIQLPKSKHSMKAFFLSFSSVQYFHGQHPLSDNHQFVTGKIMTREPSTGKEPPNDTFLTHIRRIHTQPIERNQLPETSNQEIGWFNKVMKNNKCNGIGAKGSNNLCDFEQPP